MGLERISQILLPMHHSVQTLEGVMWPQLPRRHSSGLFLFALFPGVISGPEGGCTVMSVCKQGGECRQGSGGGDEGTSGSPKVGEGRKNLSSDKETQGKWQWSRRGGGGGGRRPPNPCKSFGKTAHRPPLIPPIKPALVCRCQGRAAVFRGALAPAGPAGRAAVALSEANVSGARRSPSSWQALANVLPPRVLVIYVPSVYINLSAAQPAGLFQPGCLLRRLGDFSCLWDPKRGRAAGPAKFQQHQERPGGGGAGPTPGIAPGPGTLLSCPPRTGDTPVLPPTGRGHSCPAAPEPGDSLVRPLLRPDCPPRFYSAVAATAEMVIYYLRLPRGSFLTPPPLPPWKGASSLPMREADSSHWAAHFGGLAGVTVSLCVVRGDFNTQVRLLSAATSLFAWGDECQAWRFSSLFSSGHCFFPYGRAFPQSV